MWSRVQKFNQYEDRSAAATDFGNHDNKHIWSQQISNNQQDLLRLLKKPSIWTSICMSLDHFIISVSRPWYPANPHDNGGKVAQQSAMFPCLNLHVRCYQILHRQIPIRKIHHDQMAKASNFSKKKALMRSVSWRDGKHFPTWRILQIVVPSGNLT